jgi:hypothetical protein
MGCTIDHLRADHQVTVLRDFRDARGNDHRAGEQGMLRLMELDWPRQEFFLEWEREGTRERMYFSLPRQGRPSQRGDARLLRARRAPSAWCAAPKPPPPPPAVTPALLTESGDYDAAVARIWALAARCRFDEAEEQVRVLVKDCGPFGRKDRARRL